MAINKGKKFETKFKEDFSRTFPQATLVRLPDQMSGYKGFSKNIADFIAYKKPYLFFVECKSTLGNTFPLDRLSQYDSLLQYKDSEGVYPFIIIWFRDHDKVVATRINEVEKMKIDGKKSINIKMLNDNTYQVIEIPSIKKRVYMDSDYSILLKYVEESENK